MRKKYLALGKEFIGVLIGQVMTVVGSFYGIKVITNHVSPTIYGEIAIGMTLSIIVEQIFFGPLCNSTARFYSPSCVDNEFLSFWNAQEKITKSLISFAFGSFVFVCIISMFWINKIERLEFIYFLFFLLIFSILSGKNSILSSLQNAARQRFIVAWHQAIGTWLRFGLAVLAVIVFGANSKSVIAGYALAMLLVNISQYLFFKKRHKERIENGKISAITVKKWEKKILRYAWPFSAWGIFTCIHLSSDRWALGFFSSKYDVGLFSVLYQIGYYPVIIAVSMMSTLLNPILFAEAGDGNDPVKIDNVQKKINCILLIMILFSIFPVWIAYYYHTKIFMVMTAKEFWSASYLLPLMTLSACIFSIGQVYCFSFLIRNNSKSLICPKIVASIVGIIFNFLGALYLGIEGVVWSNIIFSCVFVIMVCTFSK